MHPNTAHKQPPRRSGDPSTDLEIPPETLSNTAQGKEAWKYEFEDAGPTMRDAQGPRKVIQEWKKTRAKVDPA